MHPNSERLQAEYRRNILHEDLKNKTSKSNRQSECYSSDEYRSQGDGQELQVSPEISQNKSLNDFESSNHLKIETVSQKLKHLSLNTSFDQQFLNSPPENFKTNCQVLIPILSTKKCNKKLSLNRIEPKFIAYEPYKACVKPLVEPKLFTSNLKENVVIKSQPKLQYNDSDSEYFANPANFKKLSLMVSDFEKEKSIWEVNNMRLKTENEELLKNVAKLEADSKQLQQQLSVQSQVNNELKKLLVASVGEDVQGRVQCLTEDKTRMANMIRKYSEKVDRDFEEKEKFSIECDVWRSKFFASSLLIDDMVRYKRTLIQHYMEAEETLKTLMQEKDVSYSALLNAYRHIHQIKEAFDPLGAESGAIGHLNSADSVSLSVTTAEMAQVLRDRLLGTLGRAVGNFHLKLPDESKTPGEKMAERILENSLDLSQDALPPIPSSRALMYRYHPHVNTDKITMNCCGKCNGEFLVV